MFTVWIVARQGLGAAQTWLDRINTHFPTLSGTAPLFLFKPVEFTVLFQQSSNASDLIWTDTVSYTHLDVYKRQVRARNHIAYRFIQPVVAVDIQLVRPGLLRNIQRWKIGSLCC